MRITPRKKQLGGFVIPPSVQNALKTLTEGDLTYENVAGVGAGLSFDFGAALSQDNPDLIGQGLLRGFSQAAAPPGTAYTQPLTQAEQNQEIADRYLEQQRRTNLQNRFTSSTNPFMNNQLSNIRGEVLQEQQQLVDNQQKIQNTSTGLGNSLGQAQSLLGLFNSIGVFQDGGSLEGVAETEELKQLKATYDKGQLVPKKYVAGEDDGVPIVYPITYIDPQTGDLIDVEHGDAFMYSIYNGSIKAFETEEEAQQFVADVDAGKTPNMQTGGKIQKLGYSDKSPYRKLPSITIDSDVIDMSKTGVPILGIPDVGEPRVMSPYSGTHTFDGASRVTEVPLKKPETMAKGGKRKKKTKYYQAGGPGQLPLGVQLEEGEVFATPEMDIMFAAAKSKHKDMKSDHITDVLRPQDYVFSDKSVITRKQADDISFGLGAMLYEEGKVSDEPKEILASKFFKDGEKSLTLAEYTKRIMKEIPTNNREDVFSKRTNEYNKASRIPYITAAAYVNELKRTKGNAPVSGFATDFENMFEQGIGALSGEQQLPNAYAVTGTNGEVPEGQAGGLIAAGIGQLFSGVTNLISSGANRRRTRRAYAQDRQYIDKLARSQSRFSGIADAARLAGTLGQDPRVDAPQYSTTQLDSSIRRVPKTAFDYQFARLAAANQPYMNALFNNTGSFSEAVNAYSPTQAATIGAMSTLGLNELNQNIQLENAYRASRQDLDNSQIAANTFARNATRTNSNQLIAGAAGQLGDAVGNQGLIQSDRINALRQNNLSEASSMNQASQNTANSIGQIGLGVGMGVQSYLDNRSAQPTTDQAQYTPPPLVSNQAPLQQTNLSQQGVPQSNNIVIFDPITRQYILQPTYR